MKRKYHDYLFLLAIVIISLVGGYLINSHRDGFIGDMKEAYHSYHRKVRKHVDVIKEGMYRYNPFHKFMHRHF
jgi:hypothetical protein